MTNTVKKREGQLVEFDRKKIVEAIFAAMQVMGEENKSRSEKITDQVIKKLEERFKDKIPQVEEVQDIVEETLIKEGMVKVAKAYILYRDKRSRIRESLKVRKKIVNHKSMTDLSLLVSAPTSENIFPWDREKIVHALVKEAELPLNISRKIAKAVEEKIFDLGLIEITTSLIRELVDNELFARGYEHKWRKQKIIGIPTFDLKQLFLSKSKENSNIGTNNPEAINLTIAENTIKQYMLQEVFSKEVANAHLKGWIHIHDLGYPRIYCSGHSLEYLKKYGLKLENLDTSSAPAKHTRTLTGHLNTFLASMQAYYAGALGIGYLNIIYAPFLVNLPFKEIKQEAQYLIFSGSQNAFSRGGQSLRGKEKIYVYDTQEKELKSIPIERFYHNFNKDKDRDRYFTISIDRLTGKPVLGKIYQAIRHQRKNKLVEIKTGLGGKICVTDDHSLFTLNKNGEIIEIKPSQNPENILSLSSFPIYDNKKNVDVTDYLSKDLYVKINDEYIDLRCNSHYHNKLKIHIPLTKEFATLLGYYVAEGNCTPTSVFISCRDDKEKENIAHLVKTIFVDETTVTILQKGVRFSGSLYSSLFKKLCGDGAINKKIPDFILFGKDEIIKAFLAGYLSGDGYIENKNKIGCSTISETLKSHLWLVFTKIGCLPTIKDKDRSKEKIIIKGNEVKKTHLQYVLTIGINSFDKVYFSLERKEEERKKCLERFKNKPSYKQYDQRRYDYNQLKPLIKKIFGAKISLKSYPLSVQWIDKIKRRVNNSLIGLPNPSVEEVGKEEIPLLFKKLFIFDNVQPHSDLNSSSMYFDMRNINSFPQQILAKNIIKKQIKRLKNLKSILYKASNLLPVEVINQKEIKEQDRYVYDISVEKYENFLTTDGLLAHNSLFLDFNVHLGIPEYLKNVPAIGPGGEYTGKNYGEYEIESQLFLKALMEVWKEGDCNKKVFAFPKMDLHINNRSFEDPEQKKLLEYACEVASENGSPYFIFDRDDISLASCCRLRTRITDQEMITHPEKLRFAGIQNVTINLPQCAYRAFSNRGISDSSFNYSKMENIELFFEKIDQALHLAIQAHLQKKKFLKMMMVNSDGALWEIGKIAEDGKPYVDLDQGTYLIGLIGLNEAVQYISGDQLHESEKAYKLGLKIVSFMSLKCEEYSEKFNLRLSLEESPAESAAGRLAKIDLQEFPDSKKVIKGNPERDESYYTNSIHFAASAPLDLITRIVKQSKFHPLIKSGAIIHAFVGENRPSPESIYNLIKKVWENTQCSQLTISPEFTICNLCNKVSRGLTENCNDCGSKDVYGVTRIVGYYSKITNWNKNKIGELKDRHSGNYKVKSQV